MGGWPWYVWVLVIAGTGLIIAGMVAIFAWSFAARFKSVQGPKSKKRGIKIPTAPLTETRTPAVAAVAVPAPVVTTTVPMPAYTYATPQITTAVAPPDYAALGPSSYAAQ